MASQTIVLILGALASVTLILSALSVHRMRLLTFSIFTTSLVVVQLVLVNSLLSTVLLCAIGLVRTGMLILAEKKFPWMNHWLALVTFLTMYTAAFVFSTDFHTIQWFQWLPFFGSFVGTISIFITNMAVTKSMAMGAGTLWSGYYMFSGMNTQLIGEGFTLLANALALVMVLRARRAGIAEDDIRDVDDRLAEAFTGSIKTVTGSIKTITQSNPIINSTRPIPIIK